MLFSAVQQKAFEEFFYAHSETSKSLIYIVLLAQKTDSLD